MVNKKVRFSQKSDSDFFMTLRTRVNDYFESNGISRSGNEKIIIKAFVMALLYILPYSFMLSGVVSGHLPVFSMWILMGFGVAGIGLCIMHDANHGTFSDNKRINSLAGYSLNIIGGNSLLWKIQHNVLHHTYTNIQGMDEDIREYPLLRFSPHQKKAAIHRFQHLYAWFLYGLMTLIWISAKDFFQIVRYKRNGLLGGTSGFTTELLKISAWKIFYYLHALVLPLVVLPHSFWFILCCFVSMHFVTGLLLSIIFQTAHVMPESEFPLPDDRGVIDNNWAIHQMSTTTNYAPSSRFFSWAIGGLNYQIEHHLFSNISHIHYRKISKIVAQTADEFGIPYQCEKNFLLALRSHSRMLRTLGRH